MGSSSRVSLTLLAVACIISSASAVAVMSVDLGTEWMKVAVVSVSGFEFTFAIIVDIGELSSHRDQNQ